MGYGVGYICKKCNCDKKLYYGIGMIDNESHYSKNNFEELFHYCLDADIKNLMGLSKFIEFENVKFEEFSGRDTYICPKCKKVETRLNFKLRAQDREFIPLYNCKYIDDNDKYCGGVLKLKEENEDFILRCDFCGSEDFDMDFYEFDWD